MDDFDILNALLRDDALAAEKVLSRDRKAVVLEEFWGEKKFLQDYAQRFVSVRHVGSNKPPTRHHRRPVHDRPETMLKLTAPTGKLQFNKLV